MAHHSSGDCTFNNPQEPELWLLLQPLSLSCWKLPSEWFSSTLLGGSQPPHPSFRSRLHIHIASSSKDAHWILGPSRSPQDSCLFEGPRQAQSEVLDGFQSITDALFRLSHSVRSLELRQNHKLYLRMDGQSSLQRVSGDNWHE